MWSNLLLGSARLPAEGRVSRPGSKQRQGAMDSVSGCIALAFVNCGTLLDLSASSVTGISDVCSDIVSDPHDLRMNWSDGLALDSVWSLGIPKVLVGAVWTLKRSVGELLKTRSCHLILG